VKKVAANLFDAEQKQKRAQDLFKQSLMPQQDLDTAETRYRSARADYDVVLQQVKTWQVQLRAEKADLALARKKLRDTEIRAPFDAYVQERLISPGQYLRVQAPVMTLVKINPLRLRADVPEKLTTWVKVGQRVQISSEAFPDEVFSGTISRITPAVKEQSRSFSVEAIINNSDHRLKPGTFVQTILATSKQDAVLLIPENALSYSFGVYKAFIFADGKLRQQEVKLGDRFGDKVEAASGLHDGDTVALRPERLKEGPARLKGKPESAGEGKPAAPNAPSDVHAGSKP
jgi:RND family efflux transporter MFP subunit